MTDLGSFSHDNLFAGDFPKKTAPVTILTGNNLVKGTLLGKITASGKYVACNSGLSNGAEVPEAVLAGDVDASGGDVPGIGYLTGDFNSNAMTVAVLPSIDTLSVHTSALRNKSIFITNPVSVLGTIS